MDMLNKSLCSTGELPMALKKSIVTLILKKPNLNADDLTNYRPSPTCLHCQVFGKGRCQVTVSIFASLSSICVLLSFHENGTVTCSVGSDNSSGARKVSTLDTFGYQRCFQYCGPSLSPPPSWCNVRHPERHTHVDYIIPLELYRVVHVNAPPHCMYRLNMAKPYRKHRLNMVYPRA